MSESDHQNSILIGELRMRSGDTRGDNARARHRPPKGVHRRRWIWLTYLLLFALSVPWYLPADETPALWLGLPYWVVLSLLAIVAIACFTAWIMQRYWPLDDEEAS